MSRGAQLPPLLVLLSLLPVVSAHAASLRLAWDPSPDSSTAGYTLSYGKISGQYTVHVDVGLLEEYEVTGLADATRYCFIVRAYNFTGATSAPTNEVCATTGKTIRVNAGGSVQSALDAAAPGDTILLQAGATFVGNFVLPAKSSGATRYITIRSSAADTSLPAPGVRMTPAFASLLPKLRSPNDKPALSTAPGAHHYRLLYLEFLANATYTGSILRLGDSSSAQNTLAEVPHNLVIDRVYIHGNATYGQVRGVALHSASTDIINSYISAIKATVESQAIAGSNGPGPFLIANNYLEAAGQNVLFGANRPRIPELVPSDITLEGNHIAKPLAWRTASWLARNLVDFRNARRVVIEGNLIENHWATPEAASSIRLHAADSQNSDWSVLQNIEFRNNIVRNVSSGITISRSNSKDAAQVSDLTIRNNLFDKISSVTYGGFGRFLAIAGATDVTVDHNTIFNDGTTVVLANTWPSAGFVFTNNILQDRGSAITSPVTSPGLPTISKFFPNGQFAGGIYVGSNPKLYPTSNYFPLTLSAVGFVSLSTGNYRLSTSSIYRNGGTDGKDPGANFSLLPK